MGYDNVPPFIEAARNVKSSGANIANKTKYVENVSAVRLIHPALHKEPEDEHGHDRAHEQKPAYPALLDKVSRARDKPSERRRYHRHGGYRLSLCNYFFS